MFKHIICPPYCLLWFSVIGLVLSFCYKTFCAKDLCLTCKSSVRHLGLFYATMHCVFTFVYFNKQIFVFLVKSTLGVRSDGSRIRMSECLIITLEEKDNCLQDALIKVVRQLWESKLKYTCNIQIVLNI